ncbi:aspartate-semialdehyde dehydrogenase [Geobacter sp. DSM 9736]|uniref:aspartate-semialdehyde dehydrogenase n=1 Tax=Geobacter sp. DSM 9736 TaxID=1277350 RepID=UPI000B4FFE04|nr:aspartate-semialdehyde dehydrogenase [Geobacter sp. DSM 9736]SNB46504.1 aspartate-semialdehyde dehydrogenase [Geobacter sp. DSM 9736]
MSGKKWNIAVVGATGIIGKEILQCLKDREFPVGTLKLLAAGAGVGEVIEFGGKAVVVEELTADCFTGINIAFFAAGSDHAREFCPAAVRAGALCIDTSAAWRMETDVPLVVPDVNSDAVAGYMARGIIAIPSAAAMQLLVALKPLDDAASIERVVVSTYQSVSSTGKKAVDELQKQVVSLLNGKPATAEVYPHQVAFNCLPQIDGFAEEGYTREETRLINETKKVLGGNVRVTATTVRVPVFYGDSASINVQTTRPLSVVKAREMLEKAPGVRLVDDPASREYPMPVDATGEEQVHAGRIRQDASEENALNIWTAADNVRLPACGAVQVAELLASKYLK